jgi:ribosomal protein S27E
MRRRCPKCGNELTLRDFFTDRENGVECRGCGTLIDHSRAGIVAVMAIGSAVLLEVLFRFQSLGALALALAGALIMLVVLGVAYAIVPITEVSDSSQGDQTIAWWQGPWIWIGVPVFAVVAWGFANGM